MSSVLQTLSPSFHRRLAPVNRPSPVAFPVGGRLSLVEAGRGGAACLIVAHHLSAYGTTPDIAAEAAPGLMAFLFDYARMAVQVFLVFGGFSLALMLGDEPLRCKQAGQVFVWRYLRLVIPYAAMLLLLLTTAWITAGSPVRPKLIDEFSWQQLAAHGLFLQDVLGLGNFSAGTWYLCIDIQFALLFLALLASGQLVCRQLFRVDATPMRLSLVLVPLGVLSAWFWNRRADADMYVPYFLAPIILGVLVAWHLRGKLPLSIVAVYVVLVAASLAIDFRPRLVIAIVTGIGLLVFTRSETVEACLRPFAPLGRISYSLFLIHYLVNWLVLANLAPWTEGRPNAALAALLVAFAASIVAAIALHFSVERPALRWLGSFKPVASMK